VGEANTRLFYFRGKDTTAHEYVVEARIDAWTAPSQRANGMSHLPDNYLPYLSFQARTGTFERSYYFMELSKLEVADGAKLASEGWTMRSRNGNEARGVRSFSVAMCPPGSGAPDIKTCVLGSQWSFALYDGTSRVKSPVSLEEVAKRVTLSGLSAQDASKTAQAIADAERQRVAESERARDKQQKQNGTEGGAWVASMAAQSKSKRAKGVSKTQSQPKLTEQQMEANCAYLAPTPAYCRSLSSKTAAAAPARDSEGRQIVRGPVTQGDYNDVHIISDDYGVDGSNIRVTNSVIEAPYCVNPNGVHMNVQILNNTLRCN